MRRCRCLVLVLPLLLGAAEEAPKPILRDPSIIRFGEPGSGLDFFKSHGRVDFGSRIDLTQETVTWLLSNNFGAIWSGTLFPGDLIASGSHFAFRDRDARFGAGTRSGIYRATLIVTRRIIYYKVRAYADLSAATEPEMAIQFYVGGQAFIYSATWRRTSHGWIGTPAELG
jgi:hypothetical protein